MLKMVEAGLGKQISNQYVKPINKCLAREAARPKNSKLNIYDLSSVFILLALGYSSSLFIFLVEVVFGQLYTTCHRSTKEAILI